MQIAEVMDPSKERVDITRCDLWTLISVQPGTPTIEGVLEMASKLDPFEAEGWGRPWTGPSADLKALLKDPIRTLNLADRTILRRPAVPAVIPPAMWVPGRDYTHTY